MDATVVNSFLDQFLGIIDSGFGLIQGDVAYVLNALIVISITLAGIQWALAQEAPMAPFFRKVLFIGFFAFLINNWNLIAGTINQSGAMLGLQAGGSQLTLGDLHNPGRIAGIGTELFGKTTALGEGMNILTDFVTLATIFIAALIVMLGFFILALQLFTALIAFKLGSLAAFIALPWGVFSGTAWVAERPLGWVVGSAIRLFVLALITSVSIAFVNQLPATLTLDAGGALNVLLFGLTVLALAWFGPQLASEVVMGQPHLAGADAFRAAQGVAANVTGTAVATRLLFGNFGRGGRGPKGGTPRTSTTPPSASTAKPATQSASVDHSKMQPKPPANSPPSKGASA
jgi:type IV secretion system protein TrbL